jgi:hypothetical protein
MTACGVGALMLLFAIGCGGGSSTPPPGTEPPPATRSASTFMRFRVTEPAQGSLRVDVRGHLHEGPEWNIPRTRYDVVAGQWGPWIDVGAWDLHTRQNRSGGLAEWPAITLTVLLNPSGRPSGTAIDVQISDRANEGGLLLSFTERTATSNAVGFLFPHPLPEYSSEFETGTEMTARHRAWAEQAAGGAPPALNRFVLATSVYPHYDDGLAGEDATTLRQLGFGLVNGAPVSAMKREGLMSNGQTSHYTADPESTRAGWQDYVTRTLPRLRADPDASWELDHTAWFTISDEIKTVRLDTVDPGTRTAWFRQYLSATGVTDADLGASISSVQYPSINFTQTPIPKTEDLPTRRLHYYAAKFGHWWSGRQLRLISDLIKETFPGMPTRTLPSSHGFFGALGPTRTGMSAPLLDLFEVGAQQSVDRLAVEDWLGLNHMYGPQYTWTGAQSFEYLAAITRSSIGGRPIALGSLITPSDDDYLRLKVYSSLAQGSKELFFWTYGPTLVGTENYWSDLRSEYDGIAKVARALERAEPVLYPAMPVADPVAILYSVSHDIWHADDPAAFVEMRLLWHALRHLGIQPDFVREEDVERGALRNYRVLYITGQSLTRKAAAAVDAWTQAGGVVGLSAGAATRDEFYEPAVPGFAATVWPPDAAGRIRKQPGPFNERVDLPAVPPLAFVQVEIPGAEITLPAVGYQLEMRSDQAGATVFATYGGSAAAGVSVPYGNGRLFATGFMPMLAYGRLAGFQPTTLEERWPPEPRAIVKLALDAAGIEPIVSTSVPVVEASLLTGPTGSALVLANYTYQPIDALRVRVKLSHPFVQAISTEGVPVAATSDQGWVTLDLPLTWTDIVLLPR